MCCSTVDKARKYSDQFLLDTGVSVTRMRSCSWRLDPLVRGSVGLVYSSVRTNSLQAVCGAHPVSYSEVAGVLPQRTKRPGCGFYIQSPILFHGVDTWLNTVRTLLWRFAPPIYLWPKS